MQYNNDYDNYDDYEDDIDDNDNAMALATRESVDDNEAGFGSVLATRSLIQVLEKVILMIWDHSKNARFVWRIFHLGRKLLAWLVLISIMKVALFND